MRKNSPGYLDERFTVSCWAFLNKTDFPIGLGQVIAFNKDTQKKQTESCDRSNMWFAKNDRFLLMNWEINVINDVFEEFSSLLPELVAVQVTPPFFMSVVL